MFRIIKNYLDLINLYIIQPSYSRNYGNFGSPINWSELESDRQLEGLFRPEANLLDVGFLKCNDQAAPPKFKTALLP
ncbi:hypothetical protein CYANOKiyG1_02540 [Okeania sp. KiyG1]|nr:hypothetical protein CYANOKiyG1_02540 [Okeania sp. KiyG1]